MSKKLSLERDFTRFLNDPTFPYKVTVCIGGERILCSGVLLAQQSSVLENKFREDDGVLMFEEMADVENRNQGLHKCVRFLHGADVHFTHEDFAIILKFASFYEITDLFEYALQWLRNYLETSKSVKDAVEYLKISNCFYNQNDTERLKEEILFFIQSNKEIFCSQIIDSINAGITGFEVITIVNDQNVSNGAEILKEWASISIENRSFIIKHYPGLDLAKLFPNEADFSTFIGIVSEGAASAESFRSLLDLQKSFFTSQLSKVAEKVSRSSETQNDAQSSSGLNPHSASYDLRVSSENKKIPGVSVSTLYHEEPSSTFETFAFNPVTDISRPSHNEVVLVENLPPIISKRRLKKFLSFAGRIDSAQLFRSDCQALITFETQNAAHNLLMHNFQSGLTIDNHRLELVPQFDDLVWDSNMNYSDEQLVIWNIPYSVSKTKLRKLFSYAGRIASIEIFPQDFHAVVTFFNVVSADAVLASDKEFYMDGYLLHIHAERFEVESSDEECNESSEELFEELCPDKFSETNLYIRNLPTHVSGGELGHVFSGSGRIVELNIITKGNRDRYFGLNASKDFKSANNLYKVVN